MDEFELKEDVSIAPPPGERTPFFIVGSGRSGTTLLRLILDGHSGIEIPPETWVIEPLVRMFPLTEVLTPEEVSEAVSIMTEDYRWPDMAISPVSFRVQAKTLERPTLVDVVNLMYRHHLARSGKRRFGDKTPIYIGIVRELSILYPGCKFIHLLRDGRDVALSYIGLQWHGGYRCYERDFDWTRSLRFRDKYRESDLDRQFLDVKYEALLRDPEATVRQICGFLGEEFERPMLDVSYRIDRVPERERVIHPKLGQPMSREAIGRWRTTLSAFECFIMEACLHKNLRKWDYQLRFSSMGWRPFLVVAGCLLLSIGPLLAKAIPYLQRRKYLPKTIYI